MIIVFCRVETIKVIYLYFFKDFNVFRPRLPQSSLPQRLSCLLACGGHQGHLLFTFQRLRCLLSRLSQSSLHFQDYQSLLSCRDNQGHLLSLHFKDFNVFRQDYQSLLSRLSKFLVLWRLSMSSALYIFKDHQSLLFQRLSESVVKTSMSPLLFKTSRSFVWYTWCLLHSFFWQVSLFVFR